MVLELRELSERVTEVDFAVVSTDRESNETERLGVEKIVPRRGQSAISKIAFDSAKKTAP